MNLAFPWIHSKINDWITMIMKYAMAIKKTDNHLLAIKQCLGMTMLEMLMVLAVGATILTVSIMRFHFYQQTLTVSRINHHLQLIFSALTNYFHSVGCDNSGVFPNHNEDIYDNLGLTFNADQPYINHYHAEVVDTGQTNNFHKPIYRFEVSADLNINDEEKIAWLAKAAHAKYTTTTPLVWSTLANHAFAKIDNGLWVLNGVRTSFTNNESFSGDNRCAQ